MLHIFTMFSHIVRILFHLQHRKPIDTTDQHQQNTIHLDHAGHIGFQLNNIKKQKSYVPLKKELFYIFSISPPLICTYPTFRFRKKNREN